MFDRTGLDIAQGNFSLLLPGATISHLSLSIDYLSFLFLQVRNILIKQNHSTNFLNLLLYQALMKRFSLV